MVGRPRGAPARRVAAPAIADPGLGPLAALAAALDAWRPSTSWSWPGITGAGVELLAHLVALAGEAEAVAAARPPLGPWSLCNERGPGAGRRPGPPGRPAEGRSLTGLLADLGTLVVEEPEWRRLDPDGSSFVDLDDPADLAAWDPGPR